MRTHQQFSPRGSSKGDCQWRTISNWRHSARCSLAHLRAEAKSGNNIADIRSHADGAQDRLERRIQKKLSDAGISLDTPVRLRISQFDGLIEVTDNHPQRALIEAALNESSIAGDLRKLIAIREVLHGADEYCDFEEQYAQNSWQAIQVHAALCKGPKEAVLQISLDSSEARLEFE